MDALALAQIHRRTALSSMTKDRQQLLTAAVFRPQQDGRGKYIFINKKPVIVLRSKTLYHTELT